MAPRTENIYVLYGSQTGNSEQAAKDLCDQISSKLSPAAIRKYVPTCQDEITVTATHMQLDDFLEIQHAAWTRLVVIFCSSYGVGQAPLGAYRFRDLCDAWLTGDYQQNLKGVNFALCGLGDSKFTTFFQNPTRILEAMTKVGATQVGSTGKADASGTGKNAQQEVVSRWIQDIWKPMAQAVAQEPLDETKLKEMQQETVAICRKINPDFLPEPKSASPMLLLAILGVVIAIAAYFYTQKS